MKFSILLFCIICVANANELHSVVVVHRHGDKTPVDFAPNDQYKNPAYWPTEPGELTNRGKQQQYALGRWLRDRYNNFLPSNYHKEDIHVRSTATDRCLMSAGANLAGLYPPTSEQMWSDKIQWIPIPIHSVPLEDDNVLRMGRTCPNFEIKYEELLKNDNFTKLDQDNRELYEFISTSLGVEIKNFSAIEKYYDTLEIEAEHNFRLPEWTKKVLRDNKKVFPDEMKQLTDLSYKTPTYTEELARLGTGRFFDTIATHFEAVSKNLTDKILAKKMVMFSAHKSTIGDITNTLGVLKLSPVAGALIFELKKNEKGDFYVNVLFKEGNTLEHLQINQCEVDCNFEKFLEILAPIRLTQEQWENECYSSTNPIKLPSILLMLMFSFLKIIF